MPLADVFSFGADGTPATIVIDGVTHRVVRVDADGHPQVDVLTSALPAGAATLAEQQTQTTALQLIDDLRAALASIATDQLRVDVLTSALPAGAATLAEQQTQTTALQLIDDLRAALATIATDQLRVDVVTPFTPIVISHFAVAIAVANTRVIFPAGTIRGISIKANPANAGNLYIGSASVTSANGRLMEPGDVLDVAIDSRSKLWVVGPNVGDSVTYLSVV